MADSDQALITALRHDPRKDSSVLTDVPPPADVHAPTRRLDGPQLALTAIRIGPGLMLLAVVIVVACALPGAPPSASNSRCQPLAGPARPSLAIPAR